MSTIISDLTGIIAKQDKHLQEFQRSKNCEIADLEEALAEKARESKDKNQEIEKLARELEVRNHRQQVVSNPFGLKYENSWEWLPWLYPGTEVDRSGTSVPGPNGEKPKGDMGAETIEEPMERLKKQIDIMLEPEKNSNFEMGQQPEEWSLRDWQAWWQLEGQYKPDVGLGCRVDEDLRKRRVNELEKEWVFAEDVKMSLEAINNKNYTEAAAKLKAMNEQLQKQRTEHP